jgi:hexosaminidase
MNRTVAVILATGIGILTAQCATVSPLFSRGYTVIPQPQEVNLGPGDFKFSADWRLELGPGVPADSVAPAALRDDLKSRFNLTLESAAKSRGKVVRLRLTPGAIAIGAAQDRDKEVLAAQAYELDLKDDAVDITGNAAAGLFYGVETFVQLLKQQDGNLWLPQAHIKDWPDLQLRTIYWDDAHHLDRFDELKRAIRQAAFYKINGFAIKLEGHFQFKSAPVVTEPQALSPAQFQDLTDYGLRYHVQLIPYLDAPAHIAFILKHPEYAHLREYPDSNYEICATNPDSVKLMLGMFHDLMDANKGGRYIILSTDEPYYVGLADNAQCHEAQRAKDLGSVGKLLAEFVTKIADDLHANGRTVQFWGEYPMETSDVVSFPKHLVNGEIYGPKFEPLFKAHGIRSTFYVSIEGEEKLFPDYAILPPSARLHPGRATETHINTNFDMISYGPARQQADLMGVFVAGWADMGLHPETFWLGWVVTTAMGWRPGTPDPSESIGTFFPLFYGPGARDMGRIYELMSRQAQFWNDSWETTFSTSRKPIFGNSDHVYNPRRPVHDQTLPLPPVPSPEYMQTQSNWSKDNSRRLELAAQARAENQELLELLYSNLRHVEHNRYNLEVFASIARLCRQNLDMLDDLARINGHLEAAQSAATNQQPQAAVDSIDQALDAAESIRQERNRVYQDTLETWYKTWLPRVEQANGRRYVHELDDVKDHLPDRTADMSYLIYRELLLPLGDWAKAVESARNQFAGKHGLPVRTGDFNWNDTGPFAGGR